jgi:hypothetical protein
MRPTRASGTSNATRRPWEPPVVTKLTLAAQKKSGPESGSAAAPQAPAAPAAKLGFSFELAFPLSARTEQ